MSAHYPFQLQPLPYTYNGLAPCINRETVCNHYEHHHWTYVRNLNELLQPYPDFHRWSLEQLLTNGNQLPEQIHAKVLSNAGGVYNHNLYWNSMTCCCGHYSPLGNLARQMNLQYGSFESFQQQWKASAMAISGSGWTWLVSNPDGVLEILNTANQQVPDLTQLRPIINLDIWEHAYYLQYQYRRDRYIDNWWCLVNWRFAEEQYQLK